MSDRHVIKIGGSLLGTTGAIRGVSAWLDQHRESGESRLLIAGGGATVEGLREFDRANPLPDTAAHWAAIQLMDANTGLLPAWLAEVQLADSPSEAVARGAGCHAVLVSHWLRKVEPTLPGERLTAGWQTTSDAITARVAACLDARLTLLKHGDAMIYDDLSAAVAAGLIDHETPRVASRTQEVRLIALPGPIFSDFPTDMLDGA